MKIVRAALGIGLLLLMTTAVPYADRDTAPGKAAVAEPAVSPLEGRDFVYYVTRPGDTLASLERRFRVSDAESIRSLNPDLNSDRLPANLRIKIPLE